MDKGNCIMKKVLWVSASVPYDSVGHAGGKIHNYYLKYLKREGHCDIKLVSFYWKRELKYIDLTKYGIDSILCERAIWHPFTRVLFNIESAINPFNRYAGVIQNYTIYQVMNVLKQLKKDEYKPDIIILQWTEIFLLLPRVAKLFPDAKYIGIEEDVTFLRYRRLYESEKNFWLKIIRKHKYNHLCKIETDVCNAADKVILNNTKDYAILKAQNVDVSRLYVWQPYFELLLDKKYLGDSNNIIFYGAMAREENWKSAIWFIENVFSKIEDQTVRLLIIGSNPNEKLLQYAQYDRVDILGYVEDVGSFLQHGLCLVAPLLIGAGVKIKVLEAMSAGIPVLTNDIGIEGINAVKGEQYLHCEKPQDYLDAIDLLTKYKEKKYQLSLGAREFIKKEFDLHKSGHEFVELISQL